MATWAETIFGLLPFGRYLVSGPSTPTDGTLVELQSNASGHLKVEVSSQVAAPVVPTTQWTAITALTYQGTVKAAAGKIYSITITNNNGGGTARWLLFVDKASAAVDGETPILAIYVPVGQTIRIEFGSRPRATLNGIVWCVSSTGHTVTLDNTSTFCTQTEYA